MEPHVGTTRPRPPAGTTAPGSPTRSHAACRPNPSARPCEAPTSRNPRTGLMRPTGQPVRTRHRTSGRVRTGAPSNPHARRTAGRVNPSEAGQPVRPFPQVTTGPRTPGRVRTGTGAQVPPARNAPGPSTLPAARSTAKDGTRHDPPVHGLVCHRIGAPPRLCAYLLHGARTTHHVPPCHHHEEREDCLPAVGQSMR